MNTINIGQYLVERRKQLNLKPLQVSVRIPIHISSLIRIESGERAIPKELYPQFASAYEISLWQLICVLYEEKIPQSHKGNIIPHLQRIQAADIKDFPFSDLCKLLEYEMGQGFELTPNQIKIWYSRQQL